jgi:hypothetical protein
MNPFYTLKFCLRSILLLFFHLHLVVPSGLFLSGSPIEDFYECRFSPMCATCLTYLILRYLITLKYLVKSTNYEAHYTDFVYPPVTLSPLGPNILLNIVFSNILSWCIHSFHSSMVLQPFVGPSPLLHFRNLFTQTVGLLGRMISPSQGRYLLIGQHKHRTNPHTDIHAFEWNSKPRSQRSSERRQFLP